MRLRAGRQPGQPGAVPAAGAPGRARAWPARRSPTWPARRWPPALFVRALAARGRRLAARGRPPSRAQLVIGRDLLLRAAVLQVSFLVAAGVAARAGHGAARRPPDRPAAVLLPRPGARRLRHRRPDPRRAGAGRAAGPAEARATARRVPLWGLGTGVVVAVLLLALRDVLPPLFTDDPAVLGAGRGRLVVPGRHAAAGRRGLRPGRRADGRRRRRLPAHGHDRVGACVGFLPLSLLAVPLGWGLAGVWTGLCLFIVLRLVGVLARVAGDRWLAAPETVTA